MKTLLTMLLCASWLYLLPTRVCATSIGSQDEHCPLCGHDYLVSVLLGYTGFSGEGPPQMPPSSCPFCFAVWMEHAPGKLNESQRKALLVALESWPKELSDLQRQMLLGDLDDMYSDAPARASAALQTRCAAALRGEKLPKLIVERKGRPPPGDERGKVDRRKFIKQLPRLIEAQKEGREAVIESVSKAASRDIVTLYEAKAEIKRGNALAFEYLVRWTAAIDDKTLLDSGRTVGDVFGDVLFEIARGKKLPWPEDIDLAKARSRFAFDCLQYAFQPARRLEGSLERALQTASDGRAGIVLKAAAGKKDRAAARLMTSLPLSGLYRFFDAFPLYYQRVGTAEDLPFLERFADESMRRFKAAQKQGRDEGWLYDEPLAAYARARLRAQLMGEAVTFLKSN